MLLHFPTVDEFEAITESLRRQRKDLTDQSDLTATSSGETKKLLERIEELRARSEKNERLMRESAERSEQNKR